MTNTLKMIACAAVVLSVLVGCSGGATNDSAAKESASKASNGQSDSASASTANDAANQTD